MILNTVATRINVDFLLYSGDHPYQSRPALLIFSFAIILLTLSKTLSSYPVFTLW